MLTLIKPQFEAGREKVGKKGVVREKSTHVEVLEAALGYARQAGFVPLGLTFSPIAGPEGNIEFLAHLAVQGQEQPWDIPGVVDQAHRAMGREEG